jgi:succinate-acetate transporter protein
MNGRTNQTTGTRAREDYPPAGTRVNESPPAQVFLQPIAAPSILGLFGFAGATFMVAAHLAGWYGGSITEELLAPFAAAFGGFAQFTAGMWAYKARDGLATAMHGMWGSFWIGFGILELLFATGVIAAPSGAAFPALGYWFIVLAAITFVGAVAALSENMGLFSVLSTLAVGSVVLAIGFLVGSGILVTIGGWILILSAILAFYTASALLLEGTSGQEVLPVGKTNKTQEVSGVNKGAGEPGVMQGQ